MFYDQGEQNIHVTVGKQTVTIKGADFNNSSVRDPRYPVAQPRVVAWETVVLRTFFSKTDLSMHLEQVWGGASWPTLL